MSREIFMKNGQYLMCEVVEHTSASNTLSNDDFLLCFHETKGDFIAHSGYGTWTECEPARLFFEVKKLKQREVTSDTE